MARRPQDDGALDAPAPAPASAPRPDYPTILVRATGTGTLPHVGPDNRPTRRARFVGRADDGHPAAEQVPDLAYYRRAVRAGSLELLPQEGD